MNNAKPTSKKPIFVVIAIAILGAIVYFYYLGGSSSNSSTDSDPQASAEASRVLALLNQIQGLRIDSSLFSSAAFKSLQDFTVAIPTDDVGRVNPFAPLPGDIVNVKK